MVVVQAAGQIVVKDNSYINDETMYRRLSTATAPTVFGGVLLIDLDTARLHEITGAVADRYYRSAPK